MQGGTTIDTPNLIHQPDQSPFRNAYRTKCNGCASMLMHVPTFTA